MGQAAGVGASEALETVITNALVMDYTGIYKASQCGVVQSIRYAQTSHERSAREGGDRV